MIEATIDYLAFPRVAPIAPSSPDRDLRAFTNAHARARRHKHTHARACAQAHGVWHSGKCERSDRARAPCSASRSTTVPSYRSTSGSTPQKAATNRHPFARREWTRHCLGAALNRLILTTLCTPHAHLHVASRHMRLRVPARPSWERILALVVAVEEIEPDRAVGALVQELVPVRTGPPFSSAMRECPCARWAQLDLPVVGLARERLLDWLERCPSDAHVEAECVVQPATSQLRTQRRGESMPTGSRA